MPTIIETGGANINLSGAYTVAKYRCSDDTSQSFTIPSGVKFLAFTSFRDNGNYDVEYEANAEIFGLVTKVGESTTIHKTWGLTGRRNANVASADCTQTVTWVDETTVSVTRSSTSMATLVFACK